MDIRDYITKVKAKEMKKILLIGITCLLALSIYGQDIDRKISFPDVANFKTLKCDFHIHTVFSDGQVWPNIRIEEALRDGLDAISLTEHLEYQPWEADMKHPDRNRSYVLAKEYAKAHDLLIIHGAEITRDMPPGHANALFINDANKLMQEDALDSYKAAREQGAFIFWNHPNWFAQTKDAVPKLTDFHKDLIDNDLLHGIEVVNDLTYSEEALKIALEQNIAVIGTSDIHGLIDYQFEVANGGHRPIMLVLAKDKSEASIKEALFANRTVAWFRNILSGKEDNVRAIVDASLQVENKGMIGDTDVLEIEITNISDARYLLENNSVYDFYSDTDIIELKPHSTTKIQILSVRNEQKSIPLAFDILNAKVGYKKSLSWKIDI